MRDHDLWDTAPGSNLINRHLCAIDPITLSLAIGAAGAFAGGMAGGGGGTTTVNTPAPTAPAPPAPPASAPQGAKPGAKSKQATFLGSSATPGGGDGSLDSGGPIRSGQKTLLGQ